MQPEVQHTGLELVVKHSGTDVETGLSILPQGVSELVCSHLANGWEGNLLFKVVKIFPVIRGERFTVM